MTKIFIRTQVYNPADLSELVIHLDVVFWFLILETKDTEMIPERIKIKGATSPKVD